MQIRHVTSVQNQLLQATRCCSSRGFRWKHTTPPVSAPASTSASGLNMHCASEQQFAARLRETLNTVPAYTWYAVPTGALTFVNERTADYLGLPKDHPLRFGIDTGAAWDAHIPLLHPDDQAESRRVWSNCLRTRSEGEVSYRVRNAQGGYRWFVGRAEPLRASDGTLLFWIGINLDIEESMQERKRAEEQRERLRQLESDLAHVNRLSMMGVLAASLAHEVKQPIATARNNARAALNFLARKPPDLREVGEALRCIVGDADRAGDIIDRIRAHIKKAPPRKDRFDLNKAVTEVVELARSAIIKHGVSLQMRLAEELFAVQGDRVQLQQVILNLTLNAIEAMSSVNGPRELSINTEQRQTNGVVTVGDSGPGIDPDQRERVFEAFYTTKSNGVGIGLSICRSIIDAHGGCLWIEAGEPRGATFQFTVPSAASELRSSSQSLRQTREPHEDSVLDAAHQGVSVGNTRPPHLARGPRRRHRGRTS
jgi:PAS domain S-box-containing protein